MKHGYSHGVFLGIIAGIGLIFAFILFGKFLAWTSPIGQMSREELAPWVFGGIPVLFLGAYFLDRWLKNDL